MYEKFKHNNIFKFLLISTAVFEIPLTSQYYGWASLVYVFKSEGYFTDIEACQNSSIIKSFKVFSRKMGISIIIVSQRFFSGGEAGREIRNNWF